jgi:hypothetical protein
MESRAVEETFARLKLLKVGDFYKTRVLTQEQQGWVRFICDHYFGALPDERARIHSMVTPEISFLFFMYAKDMAVEAVRERQEEKIFKGLIALAVENRIFDWRDSMTVLVLLHHSAAKIGADPSKLFQQAAAISTPQTSERFLQFSARTPENLDLAKFGYQEGSDSEGNFAYVPI